MKITQQLFENFREGNIEQFYQQLYPSLLRYAERILGDQYAFLAEDCLQESIYKVYLRRQQFADVEALRSYLFVSLRNEIVSLYRKGDSHIRYLERRDEPDADCFFDSLVMQETLDRLYAAVDLLPSTLRELFELSFEQGLQNVEIARQLDLSPETIKKRKARMLALLRGQLRDDVGALSLLALLLA